MDMECGPDGRLCFLVEKIDDPLSLHVANDKVSRPEIEQYEVEILFPMRCVGYYQWKTFVV
jgi:hypothetical protein